MNRAALRGAPPQNACSWIGALSLISAAAIGTAAIGYAEAWAAYFFLFALAAFGQLLYGALFLLRPWCYQGSGDLRREPAGYCTLVAGLGLAANLAFLGTFIFTRAQGMPFGPLVGQALHLGSLGLLFLVTEALLILALAYFLGQQSSRTWAAASQH